MRTCKHCGQNIARSTNVMNGQWYHTGNLALFCHSFAAEPKNVSCKFCRVLTGNTITETCGRCHEIIEQLSGNDGIASAIMQHLIDSKQIKLKLVFPMPLRTAGEYGVVTHNLTGQTLTFEFGR